MKKFAITIAALLVLSSVAMGQVGTPSSPCTFYFGGALSMPTSSDFKDGWNLGYHGMIGAGLNVAPRVQMVGKIEYHKFNADLSSYGSNVGGGGIKTWLFGVDGRLNLSAPVVPIKPFALGGIGMARVSAEEYTSSDPLVASSLNSGNSTDAVSKVYFNFGGGVDFTVGPKTSLFVQARYVSIATDGSSIGFIPITVGLKIF